MAVTAEYHRRWRAEHRESCDAAQKRYIRKHGRAVISLASNHGLSMDEARAVLAAKPECCEICGDGTRRLYYDHDHATHVHRGWLCNGCNVALRMVENPELLGEALLYLERTTYKP